MVQKSAVLVVGVISSSLSQTLAAPTVLCPAVFDREVETPELDRRLFGFVKKIAGKLFGREELNERELDGLITREFQQADTIAARELDKRLFGFVKKIAGKLFGREDLSECELDELITREFEETDTIAARELDKRLFGFVKKIARKLFGREGLSERELDGIVARALEDELDAREYGIDELD